MSQKIDIENKWNFYFEQLKCFREENGHCDVPYDSTIHKELVKWIKIQRKAKHKLSSNHRDELLNIGFDFTDASQEWNKKFENLSLFARKFGHPYVPSHDPEYTELHEWTLLQVKNKDFLNYHQKHKLEYLGLRWDLCDIRDWKWQEMYDQLKAYYSQHGHSRVPQKWDENPKLSNWIIVQRRRYMDNKMRLDRKKKLDELHFVWDFKEVYDDQWEEKYLILLNFVKQNGHCKVPLTYHDQKLAGWVDRQRTMKSKGKLSAERCQNLDELGFIWDCTELQEKQWEERFDQLVAYKQTYQDCMVPVNWKKNKQLGIWVGAQRTLEKNNKLDADKKARLQELGFVWHGQALIIQQKKYDEIWEKNYHRLVKYKQANGKLQVSLKIDRSLQRWTCDQRKKWIDGKLDKDKKEKLSKIGFPWDLNESYWINKYQELIAYKKEFGHTRVPWRWDKNPQLGQWVSRTRSNKYTLSNEQIVLLKKIDFDWKTTKKTITPWTIMYQNLVNFKNSYGHTRVPVNWSKNKKLGKWISRIRSEQNRLNPERKKLLEELNFDWEKKRGRFKLDNFRLKSA